MYLLAGIIGALLTANLSGSDPMSKLFFIDLVLTIFVYLAGYKYNNASIYDPYWSVIPFFMLFYWIDFFGLETVSIKVALAIIAVSFWSWRLTHNWWRGWRGMDQEDWRYVQLRQQTGKWYPMVNFLGIHLFPTLIVFVATIPLYYIFMFGSEANWLTWLGFAIAVGGALTELIADNQLRRFKKNNSNPMAILRSGVWKKMRHPNYLGEILFWTGLMLMAYTPYTSLSLVAGPVLMLAMFVIVSIPMIDKKLLRTKPEYTIYKENTWALFPKFTK